MHPRNAADPSVLRGQRGRGRGGVVVGVEKRTTAMADESSPSSNVCYCCSIIRIPIGAIQTSKLDAEKWDPSPSNQTLIINQIPHLFLEFFCCPIFYFNLQILIFQPSENGKRISPFFCKSVKILALSFFPFSLYFIEILIIITYLNNTSFFNQPNGIRPEIINKIMCLNFTIGWLLSIYDGKIT